MRGVGIIMIIIYRLIRVSRSRRVINQEET
jgi:hypothetical protein